MDNKLKKKSFCKWDKDDLKKNWNEMAELVGNAKYICEKCLRTSNLKGNLCKPEKLVKSA